MSRTVRMTRRAFVVAVAATLALAAGTLAATSPVDSQTQAPVDHYVVVSGDTWTGVARKYCGHCTTSQLNTLAGRIRTANRLSSSATLTAGNVLHVTLADVPPPSPTTTTTVAPTTTTTAPPAPGPVKAFDSSDTITSQAFFNGMYAKGYRLYVLHVAEWPPSGDPTANALFWNAKAQIDMAVAAGLKVGAYTRNPVDWQMAFTQLGQAYLDKLTFWNLDIESDGYHGAPGEHPTMAMVNGIRSYNVCPILYTGRGMWNGMGIQGDWSFLRLWDTRASEVPWAQPEAQTIFQFPPFIEYGGWTAQDVVGVQLTFATLVTANGVTQEADLDVWDGAWLTYAATNRGSC